MMTRINLQHLKITTGIIALLLLCTTYVSAQNTASASDARPKDMIEVGVHGGSLFVSGEIDPEIRYGYGFHVRKAIDYMFSLRFDAMIGSANGLGRDGEKDWTHETKWSSGSILALLSLNNIRLDTRRKKMDVYVLGGGGGNYYQVAARTPGGVNIPREINLDRELAIHVTLGAGIAFRVNDKFNIGIEHQATSAFGRRSDLLDGIDFEGADGDERSGFSDILNYTNLRLNFNIGNSSSKSVPLYWGNLSDGLASSIDDVKRRQETALADTDLDGVIDAIDQEPNTPANVPVDTKGRTLDSDKDGIPDYKDLEPYYPPRAGEQVNEDGVVVNPIAGPGGGVTEERVKEMIDEALSDYGLSEPKNNVAEWFLPMIHFGSDSYRIKYSDYGTMASIARMLKSNTSMRLVITGFTDQSGPESYNEGLSYQRAAAIAEHLVNQHGIGRGRLVLQWKGQDEALVPSGASYMNRRVEFRVASENDYEMDPPAGLKKPSTDGY